MKNNNLFITVIAVVITGGIAFFGGMKYQQSKNLSQFRQFSGNFGGINNMKNDNNVKQGGRMGFRPVNGEIISADNESITVKLQDGSSKIVFLSNKTTINKADVATKSDLKNGEKIVAFGTENSDGSMTAQNIQLNPSNIMKNNLQTPPAQ